MRKRTLNKRINWDFQYANNPSSNFYPVTSALAIRDPKKNIQFTVMTSRTHSGTVLKNGHIEFL
jgi:hypothetical protein